MRFCVQILCEIEIERRRNIRKIKKAFGDVSLSCTQVFRWHKMFSEGQETVEDESDLSVQSARSDIKFFVCFGDILFQFHTKFDRISLF